MEKNGYVKEYYDNGKLDLQITLKFNLFDIFFYFYLSNLPFILNNKWEL